MSRHRLLPIAIAAGAIAFPLAAQARTWVVDAMGGGDFTDLPPALAAARDGDTLRLRAGAYTGGSTSKALAILGDAGAQLRVPNAFNAALTITALPADRTFVLAGLRAIPPDPLLFPGIFVRVEGCAGRVHLERLSASLAVPPSSSGSSSWPVTVVDCRHVTLQNCSLEGYRGMDATDSTVILGGSTLLGQHAVEDPRIGLRSAQPAASFLRCRLVLSEPRLYGGNGTLRWLGGGYLPPGAGLLLGETAVTIAGSGASWIRAGDTVPLAMPAIDGTLGGVVRDPRVVLRANYGAPLVAATIPDQVKRLPRVVASGAPPGSKLTIDLLASAGELADIYVSLPAYLVAVPPFGDFAIDPASWIVLGRFEVPPSETVTLSLPVPNEPSLTGLPIVVQALAGSAMDFRLSTPATVILD